MEKIASASNDFQHSGIRSLWIISGRKGIVIALVPVSAPFSDVPDQVVSSVYAGAVHCLEIFMLISVIKYCYLLKIFYYLHHTIVIFTIFTLFSIHIRIRFVNPGSFCFFISSKCYIHILQKFIHTFM